MNYLGIDFGSKNLGLAIAGQGDFFSRPLLALKNDESLFANLEEIIEKQKISTLILGAPLLLRAQENTLILKKISAFKGALELKFNLPVFLIDESLTSSLILKENVKIKGDKNLRAATLILNNFLEKNEKPQRDF